MVRHWNFHFTVEDDYFDSEGYHKWECNMSNAFKTILDSFPEEKRTKLGDLVDVTRMALRAVCQEPLKTHKARMARCEARGANDTKVTSDLGSHDLYNLVSHIESQSEGKVMWFVLAASCYLRNLQVTRKIKQSAFNYLTLEGIWIFWLQEGEGPRFS